jgi:hypothetical protein
MWGFLVVCKFDTSTAQRIAIDLGPIVRKGGPFTCCELLSGETQVFLHPRLNLLLSPWGTRVLKFFNKQESRLKLIDAGARSRMN